MMNKQRGALLIFLVILASRCNSPASPDRIASAGLTDIATIVLDGNQGMGRTADGHPYFFGYVKNLGPAAAKNCQIIYRAYADTEETIFLDVARGYAAHAGIIDPGQRVYFEATFSSLTSFVQVKRFGCQMIWENVHVFIDTSPPNPKP